LWVACLFLAACGGLKYPLDKPLTGKTFEPRHEPEQIELYFSHSSFMTTISGSSGIARSMMLERSAQRPPPQHCRRLRKLRTQLVMRAVNDPDEDPPTDDMIEDGLGQLRDAAAEAGADALLDVFAWVVFDEYHAAPRGVVLQGIAVRCEDR
jgi:hypothetical protein